MLHCPLIESALMTEAVTTSRVVRFGVFEVDLDKGEVRKSGLKLRLRGQPFQVLSILLEHPGEVVTREEFQQRLWTNDETFVDFEHGLNAVVNRLREVLGDSPENPRFIETVPRRGYRWMLPVDGMEDRSIPAATRHRWRWLPLAVALLLGIGLGAGVLRFVLSSPKSSTPALTSVPLTARPGFEYEPSFSPDGNQVAFTSSEGIGSKSHIYVKLIGTGGPPLQLTNGPANDSNPVWSPDGRFIAFLRYIPGGPSTDWAEAILLIPALGGPERKIAETRQASVSPPFLAWSPNGNFLVISHKDSPKEPPALFVVAIDSGEKRRLTSPPSAPIAFSGDSSPAFSPDGRTLAFIRSSDVRTELYLLPVSDALEPVEKPGRYHWDNPATLRLGRRTGARLYFRLSAKDSGELVFPAPTPDLPNLRDSRLETMLRIPRFRAGATGSPTRTFLSLIAVSGAWPHRVVQAPAMVPRPDPPIGHSSPQRKMTLILSSHQTGRELRSYQSARGTLRSGYATAMVRVLSK